MGSLPDYIMNPKAPTIHGFDTKTVKALNALKKLSEVIKKSRKEIKDVQRNLDKVSNDLDNVMKKISADLKKAFPKPKH
jgi:predicted  nucleic acid-binding Zn-ribbon protein